MLSPRLDFEALRLALIQSFARPLDSLHFHVAQRPHTLRHLYHGADWRECVVDDRFIIWNVILARVAVDYPSCEEVSILRILEDLAT